MTRPDRRDADASSLRFAATLLVALLTSAPAFVGVIRNRLSLPAALTRFSLALVLAWVIGGALLAALRRSAACGQTPDDHPRSMNDPQPMTGIDAAAR